LHDHVTTEKKTNQKKEEREGRRCRRQAKTRKENQKGRKRKKGKGRRERKQKGEEGSEKKGEKGEERSRTRRPGIEVGSGPWLTVAQPSLKIGLPDDHRSADRKRKKDSEPASKSRGPVSHVADRNRLKCVIRWWPTRARPPEPSLVKVGGRPTMVMRDEGNQADSPISASRLLWGGDSRLHRGAPD